MRVALARHRLAHCHEKQDAMVEGIRRHGDEVEVVDFHDRPTVDVLIVWGARRLDLAALQKANGGRLLVMEHGFLGDRNEWTSLGFDGLNGRADFGPAVDDDSRMGPFRGLVEPWREDDDGYVLFTGQVPGDAALAGINYRDAVSRVAQTIRESGRRAYWRPHPLAPNVPCDLPRLESSLDEALAGASLVVTINSNSGVDAVVAGRPTVTLDVGAMAYPVTTHDVLETPIRPDREAWLRRLSWCQWSIPDMIRGEAWAHLRTFA